MPDPMEAPEAAPKVSRRAAALGTENAFVVLAEVNALARQGKDIISFCIGQPDFPAPVHVHEARDVAFDLGDLEKLINKRTKLLILNYPHNPTGGSLSKDDLLKIGELLKRHPQVWVYADEIYSRLVYGSEFFSIARVPGMYERTIISDGASKAWAMTGWRIGFTSNPKLAPVFTRWITNTEACASQISQWAAVEAINGPQDAAEMMKASF